MSSSCHQNRGKQKDVIQEDKTGELRVVMRHPKGQSTAPANLGNSARGYPNPASVSARSGRGDPDRTFNLQTTFARHNEDRSRSGRGQPPPKKPAWNQNQPKSKSRQRERAPPKSKSTKTTKSKLALEHNLPPSEVPDNKCPDLLWICPQYRGDLPLMHQFIVPLRVMNFKTICFDAIDEERRDLFLGRHPDFLEKQPTDLLHTNPTQDDVLQMYRENLLRAKIWDPDDPKRSYYIVKEAMAAEKLTFSRPIFFSGWGF